MKQVLNVHDKFFREIFARQEVAKSFLEAYLPEDIAESETLPPVFPMILYHGKAAWKLPENFQAIVRQDSGSVLKEYIPEFRYRLYDFSLMPDEEIRGEVLTRIVLLMLKHIFDPDLAEKLPEILFLFREVASRDTALEILEILLRYVVHTKNLDEKDIGQIIRKASVGDEIMQTFIEKYIHQGEMQAGMRLLLKMMAARFGKIPRSVKKKVETADFVTIENWSIRLLHAQTLEEVLKS